MDAEAFYRGFWAMEYGHETVVKWNSAVNCCRVLKVRLGIGG
jgi:hypothetical protein